MVAVKRVGTANWAWWIMMCVGQQCEEEGCFVVWCDSSYDHKKRQQELSFTVSTLIFDESSFRQ